MGLIARAWSAVTYKNGAAASSMGGAMTESAFKAMVKKAGARKVGEGRYVAGTGNRRTEYRQY